MAGTVDAVHTACSILGDGFDYRRAFSAHEALAVLDSPVDLIVCSMRFDDGSMVEFLHALQKDQQRSPVPVVCFHAHGWEVSRGACAQVQAALRGLGDGQVVDLYTLARERGVSAAVAELREAICSRLQQAA
ncbi:MAG TPA: hypothetical protein VE935_03365 [Burkholderiales bacterium]|nr:hypothetical protein [Burkholderiales bacterium]